ncbi:hypothetical protein JYU34_007948 [Plutella xylostella]|uniref:C2H2-type domain-containing protein n=1 Tax=Plutella xylostella TaxID=51655 RepID=A0ABQ7QNE8_PLUXY|nr:hypothetical protein JYU34_007948 [Plutella xylostella]KAG7306579.1 hypothetical protein JYU34_007948 [Plutella xylostella]
MLNASSTNVLQAPSILSLIRANCCTTCLSSDRRLYPIKAYLPELRYLCKEVSFSADNTICYECKAILTKILKFRQRAIEAMNVLLSLGQENSMKKGSEINIDSLSSLTCSNIKNTFDAEYDLTDNIIPIEVKIEYDESSIKGENQDTSDGISDDDDREPLSGPKMEGSTGDAESPRTPWKVEAVTVPAEFKEEQENMDDNEMPFESLASENKPTSSRKLKHSLIYSNSDQPSSSLAENERAYDVKIFSSETEMLDYRETMKKPSMYTGRSYKCEKCIIAFSKQYQFDNHMKLHDVDRGPFMCRFCEQRFDLKRVCEKHVYSHFRYYACRHCSYRHHTVSLIKLHMQRNHREYECGKCDLKFSCYREYNNHTQKAHGALVKCNVCDKTLATRHSLRDHMQRRHQGVAPVYECNVCDKKYKGRQGLALHIKTTHNTNADDGRPPAYCVECNKHFPTQSIFKQHLQTSKKHAAPRYECDHCGSKSINKQALQHHIDSTHMKIPRYECETCDQKFITILYLKRHKQNAHGGKKAVKKHVCHVCGKEYTVKKNLAEHMNTHSGLRPFECNVCGDTFARSASLYTHNKLKHLKIKPESWKKKKKTTS